MNIDHALLCLKCRFVKRTRAGAKPCAECSKELEENEHAVCATCSKRTARCTGCGRLIEDAQPP